MKNRVYLYRSLLLLGSSLIALLLAEGAVRILFPVKPSIRFQQDVDELQGMNLDEAAAMIQNDPELFWRLKPDTTLPAESWPFFGVVSNSQSLREDHDIPFEKPAGQIRILFLGDSCTFGYGVSVDQSFVEIAESLLQMTAHGADMESQGKTDHQPSNHPAILPQDGVSRPVECINAGVPGYTLFQGYRYLVTKGLDFHPDLVVLNFGWNDYGTWDQLGDIEHCAQMNLKRPPGFLGKSRLCQLVWGLKAKPVANDAYGNKRPRLLPGEFADTLGKIHSLLAARRIPMLILVWPMRTNTRSGVPTNARTSLQKEMIAFGQIHPLSTSPLISGVLDLVPIGRELVREHGAAAIYFDQGHVNQIGHEAFGQAIAKYLTPWLKSR